MNSDYLEEIHYREQVSWVLDSFLAGRSTVLMATINLMPLFPLASPASREILHTTLTLHLQDLAEVPAEREDYVKEIVGMVLDARRHEALQIELGAAIAALQARGHSVEQISAFGRFRIDGTGEFSVDDLLDRAGRP
jgi:hypothetical protein